jgi:hypothetical protein
MQDSFTAAFCYADWGFRAGDTIFSASSGYENNSITPPTARLQFTLWLRAFRTPEKRDFSSTCILRNTRPGTGFFAK